MIYKRTVSMSQTEYKRVNDLLALSSLSEMTDDKLIADGANTDQHKGIFYVKFQDGSELTYDLCSGTENYYDDVIWRNKDYEVVLECTFVLCGFQFDVEDNTYVIEFDLY